MKDRLKVAVVQLTAHGRDQFSRTSVELLETLTRIAREGAELIICPEATIPAYVLGPIPLHDDEYRVFIDKLAQLTQKYHCHLVCGGPSFTQTPEIPENAALLFGPDGFIAAIGKRFLWHFDYHWFVAGASLEPIDTSIGKLGIMICADGRIPTIASTLVDRGAEILVMPTAWVSNAANLASYDNIQADLFAGIRAWENGVPLLIANKVGVEKHSVLYCGKSQIIASDGTILEYASCNQAEILLHTLERIRPNARRSKRRPAGPFQDIPLATQTRRVALAPQLDAERFDVARWSDVDLILCDIPPNFSPRTRVEESSAFHQTEIVPLDGCKATPTLQTLGLSFVLADDNDIADPGFLPPYVLAGFDCCIWRAAEYEEKIRIPLARTRAIELKIYVIVFSYNPHERSFIIDPDGILLGGTTHEYRLVQWIYDPQRTHATTIVPRTNIHAGLRYVEQIISSRP